MTSTYCTSRLIAVPENEWLCDPLPPAAPDWLPAASFLRVVTPFLTLAAAGPFAPAAWVWLGIWVVARVVAPIVPPTPCEVNAEVNATEPPELAAPLTTRSALLSCVVSLVHPVGALVCWNSIFVPLGINAATAAVTKAVLAICVLFVPADAVGAVGVPVRFGLSIDPPLIVGDVSVLLVSV